VAPMTGAHIPIGLGIDVSRDGRRLAWSTCVNENRIQRIGKSAPTPGAIGGDQLHPDGFGASPGAAMIAALVERSGEEQIWLVDTRGAAPARVVATHGLSASEVGLSADGARYAIATPRGLHAGQVDGDDRGSLVQITNDPSDAHPAFRFGGGQILFTRRLPDGRPRVMQVPVGGGDASPLLQPGTSPAAASPVDDRVVYLEDVGPGQVVPKIWNAGTGAAVPLARELTPNLYHWPTFSKDATRVALTRGTRELIEVDVARGVVVRRVPTLATQTLYAPAYTADGLVAVVTSWRGNLWIADVELGVPSRP